MEELEKFKTETIKALQDFQNAYTQLVRTLTIDNDGVNIDLSKGYPFNESLEQVEVKEWVEESIKTISNIDNEEWERLIK